MEIIYENDNRKYIQGDIHNVIKTLETDSIDFIYTDPPFATTKAKWDKPLRWEEIFKEMWRVLKPNGIICLYSAMPFTYELYKYDTPKYHYSWKKNRPTGFFNSKKQPLRCMEEISIYYKKMGTYNPQMDGDEFHKKSVCSPSIYYNTDKYTKADGVKFDEKEGHTGKYPTGFKDWKMRLDGTGITRTDEQMDYFISTYTNEGDTILDMTCHNNYVGDRCELLNRKYIGVDIDLSNLPLKNDQTEGNL